MIDVIAEHQLRLLRRERLFIAILAALLLMTALAGFIGWSSHNTIVKVYDESSAMLASEGKPAPPDPFALKPTLSLLGNMTIYIMLIGALLAIIVGHLAIVSDRAAGSTRLIFARPVRRSTYLLGKLTGIAVALGMIMVVSYHLSVISLVIVNDSLPSAEAFGRLALFYLVSFGYMMLFAMIGVTAALVVHGRSLALLVALGVWMIITFMIPQFTSGLRPTASLTPVVNSAATSQRFFEITSHFRSVSLSELYRDLSIVILQTDPTRSRSIGSDEIVPISLVLIALVLITAALVNRLDLSEQASHD
jgi:ABC-type transport system involved in multi-copper enzyme maturation permease subunit